MPAAAASPPVSTQQIDEARRQIKAIRAFIDDVRTLGGSMPDLVNAVDTFERAVSGPLEGAEIGLDVASAAEETRVALAAYTTDLKRACAQDEFPEVCEAQIDRAWQGRNVQWVLSVDNRHSSVRLSIRNTLQRHLPQFMCNGLSWCR